MSLKTFRELASDTKLARRFSFPDPCCHEEFNNVIQLRSTTATQLGRVCSIEATLPFILSLFCSTCVPNVPNLAQKEDGSTEPWTRKKKDLCVLLKALTHHHNKSTMFNGKCLKFFYVLFVYVCMRTNQRRMQEKLSDKRGESKEPKVDRSRGRSST